VQHIVNNSLIIVITHILRNQSYSYFQLYFTIVLEFILKTCTIEPLTYKYLILHLKCIVLLEIPLHV